MTFYAVELEGVTPAYGWQAGPMGNTRIRRLRNGHERRNAEATIARHTFILPFQNIRDAHYLEYLKAAHMAMWAQLHSFLVKDWLDYQAVNQSLGNAPAGTAAVQLVRTYGFGPATRSRDITRPEAGAVVYQNGVAKEGVIDTLTGLFTPSTSWTEGQPLTWTGEFRVPVRFNNDYMPMSLDSRSGDNYLVNGSVELIEVFGE